MFGLYSPLVLLQLFCLYHAYKRHEDYIWFWVIIFLPLIGSIIYLYHAFYSKRTIMKLKDDIQSSLKTNYKIDKLEKDLIYSSTVAKKTELAEEYFKIGDYAKANTLLESCLEGIYKNDTDIIMKLIKVNFKRQQYNKVIEYGELLLKNNQFDDSDEKIALAWSYAYSGKIEKAKKLFQESDRRFSNYDYRLEYAKFLEKSGDSKSAIAKIEEMLTEINAMDKHEKRMKKTVIKAIKNHYSYLIKSS